MTDHKQANNLGRQPMFIVSVVHGWNACYPAALTVTLLTVQAGVGWVRLALVKHMGTFKRSCGFQVTRGNMCCTSCTNVPAAMPWHQIAGCCCTTCCCSWCTSVCWASTLSSTAAGFLYLNLDSCFALQDLMGVHSMRSELNWAEAVPRLNSLPSSESAILNAHKSWFCY